MALTSFQTGRITLNPIAPDHRTASVTLATPVVQSNSILLVTARGGSNRVGEYNVRVTLSTDGTTVTASRVVDSTEIIIEFQVIEAPEFNVQHFETAISGAGAHIHNHAIVAVDTGYAFPISTGMSAVGTTRGSDDFVSVRIASSTNVELQVGSGSSITVAYQIVEMSASEIVSVQEVSTALSLVINDVTIAPVDIAKSLIFASAWVSGTGSPGNRHLPTLSLISPTELRLQVGAFSFPDMIVCTYVVEFSNLPVTHVLKTGITGLATTEVLGAVPANGGAIINGLLGRYVAGFDNDDDSQEGMVTAVLSGSTWTFERTANTTTFDISYSVFDWDDLFSISSPALLLTSAAA